MHRNKVAIIVKYFYPIKRPSGISSFVYELANIMAQSVDLSVISYRNEADNNSEYFHNNYKIYKVNRPFPTAASKIANKIEADTIILFSGIYQPFKVMLYFGLLALKLRCKKVVFCQATNYNARTLPWYYKYFLRRFYAIIATNDHMRQQYERLGVSARLIPPGVNIASIEASADGAVQKYKDVRIGFFGHYYKIKGPDRLLNAFLSINPKNAELLFAGGEGELKDEILARADQDRRINIVGWQENIFPYLASCDVLVLPYRGSYSVLGYSQAALEAMALSIPVIGTPTPSLGFLIKNGYNGYVVNSDEELRDRLEYVINHAEKIRELGSNARRTIIDGYDIKKITNEYLNTAI